MRDMIVNASEFVLSAAGIDDIPEIHEIEKLCFSVPWTSADFSAAAESKNCVFICAKCARDVQSVFGDDVITCSEGSIAGFAVMMFVPPSYSDRDNSIIFGCADIADIAVTPALRRRGLARMMMNYLLDKSKELLISTLMLEVRKSNISAKALYSSFGFYETGIRKNYYSNPKEDAILMNYDISADDLIGIDFNKV